MSGDGLSEEAARLLRQRQELGGPEVYLDGLSRRQVLDALCAAREGVVRSATASDEAPADPGSASDGPPSDDASAGPAPDEGLAAAIRSGEKGEEAIRTLDYEALETTAAGCQRCRLAEERTQVVFSDGNADASLMVVGEAPGAREDATGLPFVGPAGKLLDLLLAAVDLSREESVYICNVLKCRPPGNRDPRDDEIASCAPYLRRQIALVQPRAILAVGTFASRLLTGRSSTLGRMRGEVYSYEGVPLVVTYHPAALLRNSGWTRATWNDFQLLREIMDGA